MKNLNIFDRNIKQIDIVFENCEVFSIPSDCIYKMNIENIKNSFTLHINGLDYTDRAGEVSDFTSCDEVSIIFNKKAFEISSEWAEMGIDTTFKDRIKMNDITHLDIIFEDNNHIYIGVPWEDGTSPYDNKLQFNIDRENMLYVYIGENVFITDKMEQEEYFNELCDFYCDDDSFESNDDGIEYHYNVPEYVKAAFSLIDEEMQRVMWNINQEEFESPFENTGGEYKGKVFEVIAYDWDEDGHQEYNFKWKDYYVRWYKYCKRDTESNREMSPEECATMLEECLKELKSLDTDEYEEFLNEENNCIQCGKKTNYQKLNSGVYACEECLNELGKEQNNLKEYIEDSLFDYGFEDYKDIYENIEKMINIIEYAKNNTSIESVDHLINCLKAVDKVIGLENNLLTDEEYEEIMEKYKKMLDNK